MPKGIYKHKKGHHLSKEHKINLSKAGKGRIFTKEHKRNISKTRIRLFKEGKLVSLKGDKNPMKNPEVVKKAVETRRKNDSYHRDDESRKKQSETMKRLYENRKIKVWNKGLTKETDERVKRCGQKQSETIKILYKEGKLKPSKTIFKKGHHPTHGFKKGHKTWNKDKKGLYSKETIKKIKDARAKQIFPTKDTSIEIKIQNFLKQLKIDFFTHNYIKDIEHSYQCDILIPSKNLVIECDGDYWHKYPTGRDIDHIRTKELIEKGFKVLRLWENEIKVMGLEEFKIKIQNIGEKPILKSLGGGGEEWSTT